jgi:hypothetical protein
MGADLVEEVQSAADVVQRYENGHGGAQFLAQ